MDAKHAKSLAISGILLVFSASFVTGTFKIVQKSQRLIESKKELEVLQGQKNELDKELQYRKSAEFIEEEARNKLNMVKLDEEVYLKPKILGDDLLGAQGSSSDGAQNPPKGSTGFFAPVTSKIHSWFDSIKDFLLLFR